MKNFFYFTNSHRNGIVFLSLIIVTIFVVRNAIQKPSQEVYDFSSCKKEISQLRQVKKAKRIKSSTEKTVELHQSFLTKKTISVEINTADTLAFKFLPAIGEVFSKRICKYRNIIGGFNSISQLMEVYGMDSIRFESIRPFLEINTSLIKRININT